MTLAVERSRVIDAPPSLVWEIVSDLDTYHQHTGTLTDTTVIFGEGQGATRRCVDASGNSWEETCTIWEPEQRYAVDVDVSTYPAKYRMLFRTFKGTWNVEPAGGQTRVTIRFEAELRRIPGAASWSTSSPNVAAPTWRPSSTAMPKPPQPGPSNRQGGAPDRQTLQLGAYTHLAEWS